MWQHWKALSLFSCQAPLWTASAPWSQPISSRCFQMPPLMVAFPEFVLFCQFPSLTCGSGPGCRIHLWSDKCQAEVITPFVLAEFYGIPFSSFFPPVLVPVGGSPALIHIDSLLLPLLFSSLSSSASITTIFLCFAHCPEVKQETFQVRPLLDCTYF